MRYLLLVLTIVTCSFVWSQDEIIDRVDSQEMGRGENVARVTLADKGTFLSREGDQEFEAMVRNMPVVSGDFAESRNDAFAEVELIDGSLLQIADRTKVEFQAINEVWTEESLTVVRLHSGSLFLHTTEVDPNVKRRVLRVDSQSGSAYIEAPGIYRIDLKGNRMSLRTYRGFAELAGEQDSRAVYSGEYATIRNMDVPSAAKPFNSFRSDSFERWAYERRPVNSVSSKYVDTSLSSYARDLDDNGSWRYDSEVNTHVWVPYVAAGWAPYTRGYWSSCGPALTWISYDDFGYLTHHYGRWMWRASLGWYWRPGWRYSPAWVAWNYHDNYVGWCALGFYDEPWYYASSRNGSHHGRARNRVTINNYWNYVPTTAIVNRRRDYSPFRGKVVVKGTRRITTRPFYVDRKDLRDPNRVAIALRDPAENRRRAQASANTTGTLFEAGRRTQRAGTDRSGERVAIASRSTGTKAPSRLTATSRSAVNANSASSSTRQRFATEGRANRGEVSGERAEGGSRRGGTRAKESTVQSSGTTTRSSTTRSSATRSTATRGSERAVGSTSVDSKDRAAASRSNVERSTDRTRATRSTEQRSSNSRTSATRSSSGNSDKGSKATRSSSGGNSSKGTVTRSSSGGNSSKGKATRSSSDSGNSSKGKATRSNSGNSSKGKATRSNGNSGNKSKGTATRNNGNKSSSSATRSSSRNNSSGSHSSVSKATRSTVSKSSPVSRSNTSNRQR